MSTKILRNYVFNMSITCHKIVKLVLVYFLQLVDKIFFSEREKMESNT